MDPGLADDVLRRRRELRGDPARLRLHRHARRARCGHDLHDRDLGANPYDHGFSLFTKTGIEIVYLYFQIPLMILVIAPAIDGLRREWREAASGLGASSFQFWRHIGVPILMPSLLSAMVLLFGNAFAAYATAYGLTGGSIGLVPIVIGFFLSGDVLDNPHLGQALSFGMFVVLGLMMLAYIPLQKISSRWMR